MGKKTFVWLVAALLIGMIIVGGCTSMQTAKVPDTPKYPDRPITVIVPFSAGSAMDLVARMMEKNSIAYLGQPLTVINKPGGSGTIGWNELVAANPDGYTIGISGIDLILQPLYGVSKYNYPTALEPIAQIAPSPFVLVVKNEQQWKNLDELIDYAKKHPSEIKFGHWGTGSISHIISEIFAKNAAIEMQQVPFRGGSEAMAALLGGHIQIAVVSPASVKEHIKSGTIRALAVTTEKRLSDPVLEAVPTFKEQGFGIVISNWFGIAAPKEIPYEVKRKLEDGFKAIIMDPEFIKNMEGIGLQPEYLNSQDSAAKWIADNQRLGKSVYETGIADLIKSQKQ